MLHQDGQRCFGIERWFPDQHLIEDDAQRVDVAAGVTVAFEALFWSHVGQGTHQGTGDRIPRASYYLGDAKVGKHCLALLGEEYVGRFDVAVDHALTVGVGQPGQDVEHDAHRLAPWHPLLTCSVVVQSCPEGVAFQQLHHHIIDVALHVKVKDLNNVGMAQGRHSLRLAAEARQELFLFHQIGA